jgi:hypothetical protein
MTTRELKEFRRDIIAALRRITPQDRGVDCMQSCASCLARSLARVNAALAEADPDAWYLLWAKQARRCDGLGNV